ncbi:hypothetical protein I541_5582 [Mycobacteroides abscessus]|nr:hypothetical protein I541_5582 [Mycobacteroides abscessus]
MPEIAGRLIHPGLSRLMDPSGRCASNARHELYDKDIVPVRPALGGV